MSIDRDIDRKSEVSAGIPLTAVLAAGCPPLQAAIAIAMQTAQALAGLHARGILHHDIRPETIVCDGSGIRAWLTGCSDAPDPPGRPALAVASLDPPSRLAYVAPERTGRIDRLADARSDLYSLGIVLYELLTGAPPFRSDDALEQIHWHIAVAPQEPARRNAAIPAALSDLVMKLLAKAPEDRYQSAAGLAHDLAACARQWSSHGRIEPFPLGRRDLAEHLTISSRLYGREQEVHILLESFERACRGAAGARLVLVEGYSGIGKTALIQQLYRPIVRQKGNFISGKFDQVARGEPFGALIQAFRDLVRHMLTESEQRLAAWREVITAALGGNGGVLAEVIPEIEIVIGPQPAAMPLGSAEAQNRFQRVLHNFLSALAQPEHPLVLFLDDLQWADAATLGLLEPLLTSPDIGCLMLLGAYRDNELDASPRLSRTLAAVSAAGVALERVSLGPLQLPDLTQMVGDTLHTGAAHAAPLSRLIHDKTGGNPFFVIQFLKLLAREGHLRFDEKTARWEYDLERIARAPLADNVVDLMTRSIRRMPSKAQRTLTLAACIGNRFDGATLAVVSEQSQAATDDDLAQAVAAGLLVGGGATPTYAFLHDRVQQAAYALIPERRRRMVHLTLGRLLRAGATDEQLESGLFDIVHHLNLGRSLIHDAINRRDLAALNLQAGRRAKSSTAHDTALELFEAGIELLDASAWVQDRELCFEVHLEAAASRYLCGQFDEALQAIAALLERAGTPVERARVVRLRSVQYENLARYAEALASAREGLALLGVTFAQDESEKAAALEREIEAIEALRRGRDIASLADLPVMADPQTRMVMGMLTDIWSAAYLVGDPTLARLISATMVRLSLEHGNVAESAYGYVTHAITVGPVRGEYQAAYEFGRLALSVNQRFDDTPRRAKICQQFHAHVNLWCRPLDTCIAYAREAYRSGLESGDFLYAAYGAATETWPAIAATQDLALFVREYSPAVAFIEKLKNTGFADSVRVILNWASALQGKTASTLSLSDASLDEEAYLRAYADKPFFACIHAVARLHVCLLLGTPEQAMAAARRSALLVGNLPGTIWPVLHELWHGLALAAAIGPATSPEYAQRIADLKRAHAMFDALAVHCAENFRCQAHLLGAEIARLEGRHRDAVDGYEAALEFAAAGPRLQYQALAHELFARFRLQHGQPGLAAMHLSQARDCYAQWGAVAKVAALQRQFPAMAKHGATAATDPGSAARHAYAELPPGDEWRAQGTDDLDLFSLLKATQAIAAEVELSSLVPSLLRIAIQNAGAEHGAMVLESDAGPLVFAGDAGSKSGQPVADGAPLETADCVPAGVVNYVRRTLDSVVLAQAFMDEQHGADPYVLRHRPRSLACLPIRRQGGLIGVLYLENRSVGAVFTALRLRTLRILATQAAISLENARLVSGLKCEIGERRQAQARLSDALTEVGRLKEALEQENSYLRRDLIANVSHDLRTPLVSLRGYLEVLAAKGQALTADQRGQYLAIAVRQGERLSTLIDELFELAKLDFKGVTLTRETVAFGELASDVLQKFQLEADARQVRLRIDAPPGLPPVDADIGLMERVLENLIGNALQHTPADGEVSVRLREDGERLIAQVADTGPGIPAEELPFVFNRFYRGTGGHSGKAGGAGLGLAITRRILELHDAQIRVESDGTRGTRFTFSLRCHTGDGRPTPTLEFRQGNLA